MIQIITNNNNGNFNGFEVNRFSNPKSLDQYDVNIIDLNSDGLWHNNGDSNNMIQSQKDLVSLGVMLENSNKAINIILFPQDQNFRYDFRRRSSSESQKFQKNIRLKDMIPQLTKQIMGDIFNIYFEVIFENTSTNINGQELTSSFYFNGLTKDRAKTVSTGSAKITTFVVKDKLLLTSLKLDNSENINNFLRCIGIISEKETVPSWVEDIDFFDDKDLKNNISNATINIEQLKLQISQSQEKVSENLKYKSILYTNGDELVEVVFNILQCCLNCNLSDFIDEKKEDFIVKFDDVSFIGEIKGVTSNIKSEHVSQLEVHYQGYLDKIFELNKTETVKSILIMNHQRNKPLIDRQPVHDIQIQLAKRNNSLIIESTTLLNLFEKLKNKTMATDDFKELLKNNSGLLKIND
jgi:hypothetical protein